QAGVSLASIAVSSEEPGMVIRYATALDFQYTLEASPTLGEDALWMPVGAPEAGDNHLRAVTVPASGQAQFFRLRREPL
ncbi:MAG: hypothetical protein KIT22_20450, partial [Verrucomicrobiae bacterium]|nr:hypothetical protein [Verrucomicrobiae bacterium]